MEILKYARELKRQGVSREIRKAYLQRLILGQEGFYGVKYPTY